MTDVGLHIGSEAPDFVLPSTAGGEFSLSSHRDKSNVLLAFFPGAFTGTCTAELCGFTSDLDSFAATGTRVVGVSVDSIPTLHAYRKHHAIEVELLSDFKREVSRSYGTLLEELFFTTRAYFIIDKSGIIRWMHFEEDLDDKREDEELLAELKKLR